MPYEGENQNYRFSPSFCLSALERDAFAPSRLWLRLLRGRRLHLRRRRKLNGVYGPSFSLHIRADIEPGGLHALMSQQLLDGLNVRPGFNELVREEVALRVRIL